MHYRGVSQTFWEGYVRPESMSIDTLGVYCIYTTVVRILEKSIYTTILQIDNAWGYKKKGGRGSIFWIQVLRLINSIYHALSFVNHKNCEMNRTLYAHSGKVYLHNHPANRQCMRMGYIHDGRVNYIREFYYTTVTCGINSTHGWGLPCK
jgi:hypothetical protein